MIPWAAFVEGLLLGLSCALSVAAIVIHAIVESYE
jgi:hypothetical protein